MSNKRDLYEYVVVSPIKSHTTTPRFLHISACRTGFSSLYAVTQADANAVESAGTTAGFKGSVWSERLWIDIDSYEAADTTESKLKEMGYDYLAYDSGGRGVHFGVLRDALPSHILPSQDRAWVLQHFPEADSSIYTHLHLFRLPGTRHETGGRDKQLVSQQRGKVLTHPKRSKDDGTASSSNFVPGNSGNLSVFDCIRVMSHSIPTSIGTRHPTLVKLTYALRDEAGAPSPAARWWIGEVNKMAESPHEEEHLDHIIKSIYTGSGNE